MGLMKIGIGAILKLTGKGYIDTMGRVRDSTHKFRNAIDLLPPGLQKVARAAQQMGTAVKGINKGVGQIGGGFRDLGMASLPISAGFALAAKSAADFEHQMKAVESVTAFSEKQYGKLGELAKQIGIETQYDPKEAGQLMEGMGKAGATYEEIMKGAGGVAAAAAAEQMELADAQQIVTQTARVMGLELSEAQMIADSYAKLSANANTNITQLGEAFKYAGPSAKKVGMDMHQLQGFLAKLGDSGLRGSIGGTAMQNMLNKMTRRSGKADAFLRDMNVSLTDANKKWRPMTAILEDVSIALSKFTDEEEKARMVTELFGIRGERAFLAFETQGRKSFESMINMSREASNDLDKDGKKVGAAAIMAAKRLEGFSGLLILLRGSISTFMIEAGKSINVVFGNMAREGLKTFNRFLSAFSRFDAMFDAQRRLSKEKETGSTIVAIVMGIKEGLEAVKQAIIDVVNWVKGLAKDISDAFGEEGLRKVMKFVTILGVVLAALGPIMLALWPIKMALSGIWSILVGVKTIVWALAGAFWPVTLVVGALVGLFLLLRNEGEGVGETFLRLFAELTLAIDNFKENVAGPFIEGFMRDWEYMSGVLLETFDGVTAALKEGFDEIGDAFSFMNDDMQTDWKETGATISIVLGSILQVIGVVTEAAVRWWKVMTFGLKVFVQTIGNVWKAWAAIFDGKLLEGLWRLALNLVDAVTWPIRQIGKQFTEFARLIGQGDKIPKGFDIWVEKGLTGLAFGEGGEDGKGGLPKVAQDAMAGQKGYLDSMADIMAKKREKESDVIAGSMEKSFGSTPNAWLNIENKMCVDGEGLNVASARSKTEVKERMGTKSTPWNYRVRQEHGAETV